MSAKPQPGPASLTTVEVLAAEYAALRPDGGYTAATDDKSLFQKVHRQAEPLSALCISGGGIRSATFGLGALQGLARRGVLDQFDYLSTVSGGGYIGGWLSAWSKRAGGLAKVIPKLAPDAPRPAPAVPGEAPPIDPIGHLRDYNSFLTPKVGALSADTWTLAATILRNILLNWMVLLPLFMVALMVPRLFLSVLVLPEVLFSADIFPDGRTAQYSATALDRIGQSWQVIAAGWLSAILFAYALLNTLRYLPGLGNKPHTRGDYMLMVLLPLVGSVLVYLVYDAFHYLGSSYEVTSTIQSEILGRLIPCLLAWLWYPLFCDHPWRKRARLAVPLLVAIVLIAAGTGAAAWVTVNFLVGSPNPATAPSWPVYVTLAPPAMVLCLVLGSLLFVGISSGFLADEDREWMSRSMGIMLMFCTFWTLGCAVVLIAPAWLLGIHWGTWVPKALAVAGVLSGWVSAFGNSLIARNTQSGTSGSGAGLNMASLVVKAAPAVFVVILAIGLSIATNLLLTAAQTPVAVAITGPSVGGIDSVPWHQVRHPDRTPVKWNQHGRLLERTHLALAAALTLALFAFGWCMAQVINVNTFSLHGMYRDRLIRAYLGASVARTEANKFTGFAEQDNLAMSSLGLTPFHVVNVTLNLVDANRLAWQQRKAQSFTISKLHCGGSFERGQYRPAEEYGGKTGITLGTAMAISGAAASPSMGSQTSAVAGFIMTLLNARLGAWLGNPAATGEQTWRLRSPRSAIRSLVSEAFGLTSNQNPYVYLTDGGHFENLGLYEMVLRRCRFIVVLDAGCDPAFSYDDLGNAVRKIRIDHGIPIEFDEALIKPLREKRRRCAMARICYSAVDEGAADGWLVYIKPVCLETEPPDVDTYRRSNPAFPHQSTNNQWFDESQTESYRMLGLATIEDICAKWNGGSLEQLRRHIETTYLGAGAENEAGAPPVELRGHPHAAEPSRPT